MAFSPYTSSMPISTIVNNTNYRNANRESYAGSPVFYSPSSHPAGIGGGYGGSRYMDITPGQPPYYNYYTSPSTYNGNCTWWCWGRAKDALGVSLPSGLGNGNEWYDNYRGDKSTSISNLKNGDIICFTGGEYGHVMFVEKIENGIVTISQSAYSQRSVWNNMACLVTTYTLSSLSVGSSVDMYKDLGSPYYYTVEGYIHIGNDDPPIPPEPPSIIHLIVSMFMRKKNKKFTVYKKGA